MKSRFIGIALAFVCLLVLPLALPAVATAADDDSDVKLSPQDQKRIDEAPPEEREDIRKMIAERIKRNLQIRHANKKMLASSASRLPHFFEQRLMNKAMRLLMCLCGTHSNSRSFVIISAPKENS